MSGLLIDTVSNNEKKNWSQYGYLIDNLNKVPIITLFNIRSFYHIEELKKIYDIITHELKIIYQIPTYRPLSSGSVYNIELYKDNVKITEADLNYLDTEKLQEYTVLERITGINATCMNTITVLVPCIIYTRK
jgi:hypothetical protein